ncbi:MAG TPA: DUF3710 domain-containing protein [Jatrophihabitans sp.]
MARRDRERRELAKLDATPPWDQRRKHDDPATVGPFDEKDAPEDAVARIDLGALRVPVADGQDVRLELNEQREIIGVTVVAASGQMQIGLYAAPRNEGIWDEVRAEIAESMASQKGQPTERTDGVFGTELTGRLPGQDGGMVPMRLVGVNGPRWFLRAMIIGPAAADAASGRAFEETFRGIIVARGTEPLPVRDAVPLRLPKDLNLPEDAQ